MTHRPKEVKHDAFYLTPIFNPKTNVWNTTTPVGYRTLMSTVARLCQSASIDDYNTNHSLRVTAATRLIQQGVDEQLIMTRTGHRTIEGVHAYKRVSEEKHHVLSGILNRSSVEPPKKKPKLEIEGQENSAPSKTSVNPRLTEFGEGLVINGCQNITLSVNYHK